MGFYWAGMKALMQQDQPLTAWACGTSFDRAHPCGENFSTEAIFALHYGQSIKLSFFKSEFSHGCAGYWPAPGKPGYSGGAMTASLSTGRRHMIRKRPVRRTK
ncbi:hypothetical protein GOZ94_01915 [Agrobacterium vitis]|uniref:hypothetical protein n=1 Tax=Agrobacterium vitis TaxID=373 RepID=UPI0012E8FB88|nr:hypothetical protein [Agrobacterium vitis]MVA17702.1 hypothetical protein [Agrobacterium vitis]